MEKAHNPVVYFEIPVIDVERAMQFYAAVFGYSFKKTEIDGYEMALFPFTAQHIGISGALVKGDVYQPTQAGVIVYFGTVSVEATLQLAVENGGKVLYPKTAVGEQGFVAEFEDTEGNRIALHEALG